MNHTTNTDENVFSLENSLSRLLGLNVQYIYGLYHLKLFKIVLSILFL